MGGSYGQLLLNFYIQEVLYTFSEKLNETKFWLCTTLMLILFRKVAKYHMTFYIDVISKDVSRAYPETVHVLNTVAKTISLSR